MAARGLLLALATTAVMASSVKVPMVKMLDGKEMPVIALGTYLGFDTKKIIQPKNDKEIRDVVLQAIDIGYRHFDTAAVYGTEPAVGQAIKMKIDQGVIKRDDVFVTTKVWNTMHRREQVPVAIRESLNRTGLEYIDLYLIHFPVALNEDMSPNDVDYMETWRAMEDIQREGLVKSIGVSNFNKEQLRRVIAEGTVKPAALEIEIHPQLIQTEMIKFCKSEGIVVMGYTPFGFLVPRLNQTFSGPLLNDSVLVSIAKKYGKTSAQVVLRWAVDRNVVPLPKSVKPKYLVENFNIFDFKLEPQEIEQINQFNTNSRNTFPSFWQDYPNYPFERVANPGPDPLRQKN